MRTFTHICIHCGAPTHGRCVHCEAPVCPACGGCWDKKLRCNSCKVLTPGRRKQHSVIKRPSDQSEPEQRSR